VLDGYPSVFISMQHDISLVATVNLVPFGTFFDISVDKEALVRVHILCYGIF
jgi:hypothetical protein